jgi:hypothetical protein
MVVAVMQVWPIFLLVYESRGRGETLPLVVYETFYRGRFYNDPVENDFAVHQQRGSTVVSLYTIHVTDWETFTTVVHTSDFWTRTSPF